MEISRKMNNRQLANLLRSIAAAYEVKEENRFRINAYERAAATIEHLPNEVRDIWKDGGDLTEIPGVGSSIASHLNELFRKGEVVYFKRALRDLPKAMFEILRIPGIGAKTAYKLCLELGIKDPKKAIEKLKMAAKKGEINKIEGFASKSEKEILEGIKELRNRKEKMNLSFAQGLAQKMIDYLSEKGKNKDILKIYPLGSLRRMSAMIGDVDIAVATKKPKDVIKKFINFPEAEKVVVAGKNTARIIYRGRQIDLKTMDPESFGSLLQHFTGSKEHNIHLREIAQKKDLSLSEYGIKKKIKGKLQLKKYRSEEDFYKSLGMEWIPPELREDRGEIEAAQKGNLPDLIEQKDIKGDLHIHSDFPVEPSHDLGVDSIKKILKEAVKLKYEYIGVSEHNPSVSKHSKKDIIDILKRKKDYIDEINYSRGNKLPVYVFNGLEIDIKPNGELAIPEEGFKYLDFAIVSVHSRFRMSLDEATKRVLEALKHPQAKILGHPTGRLLGWREGYDLDWDKIFDVCKKNNKWLEINAWPNRLDLQDEIAKEAVKNGVKMVINTDAHAANQLGFIKYGIATARRGWVSKNDIINTMSYNKISKILKGGE